MEQSSHNVLRITRRAADRLRAGHLWIYRTDMEGAVPGLDAGALVTVVDGRGIPLGSALYSDASQIAARMVSRCSGKMTRAQYLCGVACAGGCGAGAAQGVLAPVTEQRQRASPDLQRGRRWLHRGIIADRYNDLVLLQLLTQGTAQDDVRVVLAEALREEFAGAELTIWERPGRARLIRRVGAACRLPAPESRCLRAGRSARRRSFG